MTSKSTFHVSICGGGIGGLTLALVIGKYGNHPVEIFESGPSITTIGAGVGFYVRIMGIMKELGLYEEIVNMASERPQENDGPKFRRSDDRDGYHWFTKKLRYSCLLVHRKDVIECLLRHIPDSCKIHTSKRLEFYDVNSETEKITLHFSDGSTAITDVLVGADGIHSATRKTMYRGLASLAQDDDSKKRLLECIDPVWTGAFVYRSLIPNEKLLKEQPGVEVPAGLTYYLGKDKHAVTYRVSQGQMINTVFFVHDDNAFGTPFEGRWVAEAPGKELIDQFGDWEVLVGGLVKCIEKPLKWALHCTQSLPHYADGKVAILGDAAHAMEPHFAAGAEQAIEDAFVLGRLLTHELTHRGNVDDVLKIYERIRLPFANSAAQRSRDIAHYMGFEQVCADGSVINHNNPEELDRLRQTIEDAWEWRNETARSWDEAEERWRAKCDMHTAP